MKRPCAARHTRGVPHTSPRIRPLARGGGGGSQRARSKNERRNDDEEANKAPPHPTTTPLLECCGEGRQPPVHMRRARRQSRYARARPALRGAVKKERHSNGSDRPEDLEDIDLRPSPLRTHLAREPTPRRIAARVSQAARRVRALVYSYLWLSGRRWRWLISSRR